MTAPAAPARQALAVVATLAVAYIASQFYRASNAVIASDLMRELAISAEAMGGITGVFFLAFGLAQIPCGILLDRFGPRRTMSAMMLFAIAGAVVFATAETAAELAVARVLMGLGSAVGLMGAMVVFARWFPPDRFATLGAVMLTFGGAGLLLASVPLAWASAAIGWRGAFLVAAAVTALLAALLWLFLRDAPPGHSYYSRKPEAPREILDGLVAVVRNRQLWLIIAMQIPAYPSVMTVAGLWAGPYLQDVHGLGTVERGEILLMVNGALVLGPILYGPLDRVLNTRKYLVLGGALLSITVLAVLALLPQPSLWQATALLVLFGLVGSYSVVIHAHARAILPDRVFGRGMTLQNTATIGGVFVMQGLTGLIVGSFGDGAGAALPETAYRAAFGFLALALTVSALIYSRTRDVKPRTQAARA